MERAALTSPCLIVIPIIKVVVYIFMHNQEQKYFTTTDFKSSMLRINDFPRKYLLHNC